ncbi:LPXTG cell wall anchor domain-containing protein [Nakamurella silvestris]|nr:LPXTG cell wall anchor domain-containing protein [Nakamurella silvestris]
MQLKNRLLRAFGAALVLAAAIPAVGNADPVGAVAFKAAGSAAAAACVLSDPVLLPGDSLPATSALGTSATTNRYGGGPAFVGQPDGLTSRRAFAVTVANTTSGTAARTLHDVTSVIFGAYLVPNIRNFSAREAIWSPADQAWVTQTGFPTGWAGRNPIPEGSTLQLFDSGIYNAGTANYDIGAPLTASTAADSLSPLIPLTGTYTGTDAGWGLTYAWDNTAGRQPVLTRTVADQIAPGTNALITYGFAQERPVNTGDYAYNLLTATTARICLPAPTVDGWTAPSIDGLGIVTGTGTYTGDQIEIRDEAGTVIGTAVVGTDLTWSLVLTEPLHSGSHLFTATETDVAWSTDAQPLTGTSAPADHPVGTPALTAAITDADGVASPAAPRVRATPDGYKITFTVTNTGTAIATDVTLGTVPVTADGAPVTVENVSCVPDIVDGDVTLAPNEVAVCTGDLSDLPADTVVTVDIHPTATSPVIDGSVSADAEYAAVYIAPVITTTPTESETTGPSTSVEPTETTTGPSTTEPTETKATETTEPSTIDVEPSGTGRPTTGDPTTTVDTTTSSSDVPTATSTTNYEITPTTAPTVTTHLPNTGAGNAAGLSIAGLLLLGAGIGISLLARNRRPRLR